MEFYLNGEKRNYEGDPNLNLMDYLRNTEKIISPKDGCSPEGVCGCCTVLLDNKAVKSCISAMKRVEGKEVVTTEGLSAEKRETVVNAFMEKGGLQCGFCTPGILMKVWPLFEKPEQPSREDFVKALNSNLCRCTGFKKIVDSCVHAAEAIQQFTCLFWKIGRFPSQIRFKTTGNRSCSLCCRRGIGRNALWGPQIQ